MSFQLPEALALDLLDRLGHDDAFRDLFATDPRAALAEVGFAPAADASISNGPWRCLQVATLASKQTIRASRDALFQQIFAQKVQFIPHALDVDATLRRVAA